ncbi:hypothetical protein F5Y12DRAFT_795030 [Xylaria sp. FL1777]|nr:hypothetical protein F5Y12DRAFT_795030 [Xylaria sp. FL1777]
MNWTVNPHPWVAPDIETPSGKDGDNQKIALAVWIIIGMASTMVVLRVYYHIFRGRRHLWSDDYCLVAALLCLIGNGVAIREWLPYKLEPNATTTASAGMVLIGSLMGLFNSLALAFSKTSLGITFMRLTTDWWKSGLGLSIFVIDILFTVQAWSYWVQDCGSPPEPYRVQNAREGCIMIDSVKSLRLTVQILSCVLDAYFTILPWMIVRPLELKRFEKIGLGVAMSFGCASLACGLVRMAVLLRLNNQTSEYQPLYSVGGYLFNYFEPGFSIVAACMPVLRKLFTDVIQWKQNTSLFDRIVIRRKKQTTPDILPLSEFPEGSTFQGKSTSNKTDTTLVRPTTPTMPSTPSSLRSRCICDKDVHKSELSK